MGKDNIRFAVIGAGRIGKRHAAMIQGNPSCELVALCDIRPRDQLGLDAFEVPLYEDSQQMLAEEKDLDVVCVATPNGLHELHAVQVLESGRHVVIEKPMALSKASCENIIHAALQHSRQVFCVMQNRYSSPSIWLREVVQQGLLGQIFMVQINCYWNRDDRYYTIDGWHGTADLDGGTLFTQFSHFIDIMYWIFGDIENIQARFQNFNHTHSIAFEDTGMFQFDFVRGGMGCLNYSTAIWDKNLESSITVIGEKGSIKVGGQYMNEVEICHVEGYELPPLAPVNPPNDYGPYKGSAANHHYVFENVVDVLKSGAAISTNALEGLKVVEIIERIYELKKNSLARHA